MVQQKLQFRCITFHVWSKWIPLQNLLHLTKLDKQLQIRFATEIIYFKTENIFKLNFGQICVGPCRLSPFHYIWSCLVGGNTSTQLILINFHNFCNDAASRYSQSLFKKSFYKVLYIINILKTRFFKKGSFKSGPVDH